MSAIDFPSMANAHHKHDEPIVLDRGNHSIVADAVAPKPFAIAGKRLTEPSRIFASSDPFPQVAEHTALGVGPQATQVSHRRTIKFDAPSRHDYRRFARFFNCCSRLSSVTRGPPRASLRRAR